MSESKWRKVDGGEALTLCNELTLLVSEGEGLWWYQITAFDHPEDAIISQFHAPTQAEARQAALEAALNLGKRTVQTAEVELHRIKQAAQDVEDAALVAAHGEVAWEVRDATFAQVHTASLVGHTCRVEVYKHGGVKWELEPEHYGHPYTWEAPDLETAKIRAAAAALREPCKRWRVTIPPQKLNYTGTSGGVVEVEAVSQEGALYKAALALGVAYMAAHHAKGEAVEVVE